MLAICAMEEKLFTLQRIEEELHIYCDISERAAPEADHLRQTIDLLVMTNMLTNNSEKPVKYRVTYPTFRDILQRLDKLNPAAIQTSLKKYDERERKGGVIL